MTEIYIERMHTRKGCLRVALILGGICLALALVIYLFRRPSAPTRAAGEPATADAPAAPAADTPAPAPAPAPAADPGPQLLAEARRDVNENRLDEARERCYAILDQSSHARAREEAEALLGEISITLALSPRPMPEKVDYTVQRGDTLAGLAKKYNTTVELITKGNNIRGSLIRAGDRYRILNGRFSVSVDKSDNVLVLSLNDRFFKRYRVGTGKFQKTPTGNFTITDRIPQPTWWRPDGKAVPFGDPDNVLGTHWLSLDIAGYGIHGTWEPETIGQQASEGCIRLLNEDVEEIYTLLPVGTPVVITE
ncbi:MAG: L,D-transpeptidase family protein [Kiritimatiellae bacterium]|nr:L,D-transpeptidase family protein [Kiritimatiellia bacterium]